MKGIIWYPNDKLCYLEAKQELEFIKHQYMAIGQEIEKENKDSFFCKNGDTWSLVPAYIDTRGYQCNISYIHRKISGQCIDEMIKPITLGYPYQAFNYYGTPSYFFYKDQQEEEQLEKEFDKMRCPICGNKFYIAIDEYGYTPWHLHCLGDCNINIGATSESECIRLLKDFLGIKNLNIEYYNKKIQNLIIDNNNII